MTFTPCPKPTPKERPPRQPIARSIAPKKENRKRRQSNKLRAYGPPERRAFVRGLPCSACGAVGFSQNAHVVKINGGMGFKGEAHGIAPLCGSRFTIVGCHQLADRHPEQFAARFPWYDREVIAAETNRAYLAFMEAEKGEKE